MHVSEITPGWGPLDGFRVGGWSKHQAMIRGLECSPLLLTSGEVSEGGMNSVPLARDLINHAYNIKNPTENSK